MSRIGRKPIAVPSGVEVKIDGTHITVKGAKGTLEQNFHKDMNVEPGTMAHITFNDTEARTKFSLSAIIVRTAQLDEGKVLYGCRLNQESPAIAKYVNDKQREKLKGSRTVGTTIPLEAKE